MNNSIDFSKERMDVYALWGFYQVLSNVPDCINSVGVIMSRKLYVFLKVILGDYWRDVWRSAIVFLSVYHGALVNGLTNVHVRSELLNVALTFGFLSEGVEIGRNIMSLNLGTPPINLGMFLPILRIAAGMKVVVNILNFNIAILSYYIFFRKMLIDF